MSKALLHSWLVIVVAAAAVSLAQTSTGKSPNVGAIVMPADTMKWQQVRSGQESAAIWGDRSSSAYGALNRFAGGFDDRPHAHTRDLRGLVVSGTMVVRVADGASQDIGPGSYIFLPGGTPHTHSCKAGAACVIFVQQEGPGDSIPIELRK